MLNTRGERKREREIASLSLCMASLRGLNGFEVTSTEIVLDRARARFRLDRESFMTLINGERISR